jgi:Ras-related protein Rab-8A
MANYETSANVKVLVGNKCDLSDQRVVSEQQGTQLATQLGCKYYETSAKTSINCEEAFMTVARECFDRGLVSTSNGQPLVGPPTPGEGVSTCPC